MFFGTFMNFKLRDQHIIGEQGWLSAAATYSRPVVTKPVTDVGGYPQISFGMPTVVTNQTHKFIRVEVM